MTATRLKSAVSEGGETTMNNNDFAPQMLPQRPLRYVSRQVRATYAPAPCKLTFDLLTLKVMSESRVTWATAVPIFVFLGLSVLDSGPKDATDVRRASQLNAPAMGAGHNNVRYYEQRFGTSGCGRKVIPSCYFPFFIRFHSSCEHWTTKRGTP